MLLCAATGKRTLTTNHSCIGIPAIIDHDRDQFSVFETAAILMYLTRHYDPEHKFTFSDINDISRTEQWVAWQHGGLVSIYNIQLRFFSPSSI